MMAYLVGFRQAMLNEPFRVLLAEHCVQLLLVQRVAVVNIDAFEALLDACLDDIAVQRIEATGSVRTGRWAEPRRSQSVVRTNGGTGPVGLGLCLRRVEDRCNRARSHTASPKVRVDRDTPLVLEPALDVNQHSLRVVSPLLGTQQVEEGLPLQHGHLLGLLHAMLDEPEPHPARVHRGSIGARGAI